DVDADGVVRVLLQSLKEPELLTLTLDGIYTVENDAGFRFRRGTQIVLQNVDGRIFLSVGGLMLDMGASMKLTRQAADGRNAIYIAETARDAYYPGDLEIRAEEGGLRCVFTVNMEDYLRGVIADEMGDAWPIESLKCQAVAARTYALYKKSSAGSRDYDVTDTTSDQVFKGIDPSFTNVDAAVYSTEGIIGLDEDGNAAKCWYTASNGGRIAQPEEVWVGSDPCTYIQSKDDPYDLENPKSVVKTLTFSSDVNESEKLKEMLQTALEEKYPKQDEIELDEIVSVETIDDDPQGSRMYKKLRFTVTATALVEVSAQETQTPEETAAPEVREKERRSVNEMFTVELSVYEQIKTELGLGINSGNYELCTVSEADGKFTIEMR
ncbi:MAG: SpoIID/LytB domain-containing protein, partial [Oscillospiraceae bacterium]|nr:SpoIID/LytB domain-containing protein [Oscillospiraceae bacterium]